MTALKLFVLDKDDLEVVSAHLQDALVKVSDIHWWPKEKRLVIALNRFDWESAQDDTQKRAHEYRRYLTALRFERVLSCRCRNTNPQGRDDVLNLLAVEFTADNSPAGVLTLIFSDGAALRLNVECLEGELCDLGPSWVTAACPAHLDAGSEPLVAKLALLG